MHGILAGIGYAEMLILGLPLLIFWLWMLVDCLKNQAMQGTDKIAWVLVIVFLNWLGALIYYFVVKRKRA